MKYIKMLGLSAVAAMALTAVGAGTASASKLCETTTNTTTCAAGWHVSSGTVLGFSLKSGTTATLRDTSGFLNDTCTGSTVTGPTANTGSSTETVKGTVAIVNLTWSGCSHTTDTTAGGTLEIHQIAGTDNGTVTANGFRVTVLFPFNITCTFETNSLDIGTLTEGKTGTASPPTMDINAVVTSTSPTCPETSKWEGTYVMTSPANTTVGVTAG
jgi:hypothetical protein